MALRVGCGGLLFDASDRLLDYRFARGGGLADGLAKTTVLSLYDKQLTENWYGQGESDCLIKTKRCDGVRDLLTQRDFCPVL